VPDDYKLTWGGIMSGEDSDFIMLILTILMGGILLTSLFSGPPDDF
jgi:hypothetical protein